MGSIIPLTIVQKEDMHFDFHETFFIKMYLHKYLQRQVADFYISDFQSGLRALVKTGYGVRVTPYVDESTVIEVDQSNIDSSPQFIRWLSERKITTEDRPMRLKEGYGNKILTKNPSLSCNLKFILS